jgi:hypothetical protein
MIMKMKYAVAFLTSLALVAMAASVPAQQDAFKAQPRSSDLAPTVTTKVPFYRVDSDPEYTPLGQRGLFSGHGQMEWKVAGSPEGNQLAMQESTLAHEANEIRHRLESATTDSQRSEVRTKLAENLGKQFDLRQKRHGLEIEALETQVKKLRELVRKRQDSREEIISRRVDQVLREAEGLGW